MAGFDGLLQLRQPNRLGFARLGGQPMADAVIGHQLHRRAGILDRTGQGAGAVVQGVARQLEPERG